jgi:UDP-N-acetylmuramoylalanine--D-glutamate ligase
MTAERAGSAVTELSSFILELFPYARRSPHVAVITNLYRDHLNRHGTMEEYARAKAQIFAHQTSRDWLILNADDEWTRWFLEQRPAASVRYVSLKPLPLDLEGIWYADGLVWERSGAREKKVLDIQHLRNEWGMHNVANFLAASCAARCAGVPWTDIQKRLATVPQVPFRQEVVHRDRALTVINDTTATSPEGGIAAVQRWGGPNCILITGGTDRELDFRQWAQEVAGRITPNNTIFLAGSATDKMKKALGSARRGIRTYESLDQCWDVAVRRARKFVSAVILFSPAAKSFELFANEFDRGQQFNSLVKKEFQ